MPFRPRRAKPPAMARPREQRPTWKDQLYGRRWKRAARRFLMEHPLCVNCSPANIVLATQVDHIIPHRGDPELFWDEANWQPLCASCHSKKTVREDGGLGRQKKNEN